MVFSLLWLNLLPFLLVINFNIYFMFVKCIWILCEYVHLSESDCKIALSLSNSILFIIYRPHTLTDPNWHVFFLSNSIDRADCLSCSPLTRLKHINFNHHFSKNEINTNYVVSKVGSILFLCVIVPFSFVHNNELLNLCRILVLSFQRMKQLWCVVW